MNIEEQLKSLNASPEWIMKDNNGDCWWVNSWEDGFVMTKMNSDLYLPRSELQSLDALPGLRNLMTRDRYWKLFTKLARKGLNKEERAEWKELKRGN